MAQYVLRIECPDATGLIHRITGVIFRNDLNIVANAEFVDGPCGRFYFRAELHGECDVAAVLDELREVLSDESTIEMRPIRPKNIVLLATREMHCLGDLLLRHHAGELGANIRAVISNHPDLGGLVERFDIPFQCVPHQGVERREHEEQVLESITTHDCDYVVLAKYMRILSPEFVARFPHRLVNIHHSFLPAFVGANPYGQAYQRGVKIIGATAHFVTDDLDDGPIIAQSVIPVDHSHAAADMAQAGRDVEKSALAQALKLVFEERVFVTGNRTVIFD
jgi:formyltetrahydrofolate deformylase